MVFFVFFCFFVFLTLMVLKNTNCVLQLCLCRCIPYRFKIGEKNSLDISDELEVLVISSQKGKGMLFPKV
jgi:hypothetical protein